MLLHWFDSAQRDFENSTTAWPATVCWISERASRETGISETASMTGARHLITARLLGTTAPSRIAWAPLSVRRRIVYRMSSKRRAIRVDGARVVVAARFPGLKPRTLAISVRHTEFAKPTVHVHLDDEQPILPVLSASCTRTRHEGRYSRSATRYLSTALSRSSRSSELALPCSCGRSNALTWFPRDAWGRRTPWEAGRNPRGALRAGRLPPPPASRRCRRAAVLARKRLARRGPA